MAAAPDVLPPAGFDAHTRAARLAALPQQRYDVLVVGGGITGVGIARDAALRGLRTCLVEQSDLASGTSSRSSKLVHGGIRYLEHYEFGLVFESTNERALLRKLAPHLVRPLPFMFPVYRGDRNGLGKISLGMWLYDTLAMGKGYRRHRTVRQAEANRLEPGLLSQDLRGAAVYYDCWTNDARITLETARSAHDAGAHILTRVRLDGFVRENGAVDGGEVTDLLTGRSHTISADVAIVAAGPWTDLIRDEGFNPSGGRPHLRPTKGVHVLVPRDRLPVSHAVTMSHPSEKRVLFAIPWDDVTVIGTTDTDYEGPPDQVAADRADIDYILDVANHYFPSCQLTDTDVLSTYAGLRPLLAAEGDASSVSREHKLWVRDDDLVVIAGGKLTTYRRMAREVVDAAARVLRKRGHTVPRSRTDNLPLPGAVGVYLSGEEEIVDARPEHNERLVAELGSALCDHLRDTYGGFWPQVARPALQDQALRARILPHLPYVWAELRWALHHELTLTVTDFLVRRTQILLRDRDNGTGCAEEVSHFMARELGWAEETRHTHLDAYLAEVELQRAWRN